MTAPLKNRSGPDCLSGVGSVRRGPFADLSDAINEEEYVRPSRRFRDVFLSGSDYIFPNTNEKLPMDDVTIEDGRVTRIPAAAQPLSLEAYQQLAMRFLSEDTQKNRGLVLSRLALANSAMMLNAALGLASEAGEVCEIYKKFFFHGHPMDDAMRTHLKKETGDVFWYLALQCFANGWDPRDILQMNIDKLSARYPGGFDAARSINRAPGDI